VELAPGPGQPRNYRHLVTVRDTGPPAWPGRIDHRGEAGKATVPVLAHNQPAVELIDFSVPLASRGYELLRREHAVSVYRRRGGGPVDLAAEGRLPASAERLQAVLIDYGRHAYFVKGVAESRVLWKGQGQLLVYQRLDLPLLSDRDYTLVVSWGRRGRLLFVHFECANQRGPSPRAGVVRVSLHRGGWLLRPTPGSGTDARYQVELGLGGSLPGWVARSGTSREIPALFASIARQARR
jgi:hypothetical protein